MVCCINSSVGKGVSAEICCNVWVGCVICNVFFVSNACWYSYIYGSVNEILICCIGTYLYDLGNMSPDGCFEMMECSVGACPIVALRV